MAKSRFRAMANSDDLVKRTEEAYKSKDGGGKFQSYISSDIPLTKWKCEEGDHILDIIPFLTGKNNPNGFEPDTPAHKVEVYVHYGVGPNENAYVCPKRVNGSRCPICELQAEMQNDPSCSEKEWKSLSAKRRVIYQVLIYGSPLDEAEGLMYWEASHYLSERNILAVAKNRRTGGFIPFAHPDDGKSIEFTRTGKGINTDYVGFKLTDRDYIIKDEVLEKCVALGDYIDILSYEELAAAMNGEIFSSEEPIQDDKKSEHKVKEEPAQEENPQPTEERPRLRQRKATSTSDDMATSSKSEQSVSTRRRRTRRTKE